jgi:hypothetical protein
MANISNWKTTEFQFAQIVSNESIAAFVIGVILLLPVYTLVSQRTFSFAKDNFARLLLFVSVPRFVILSTLLTLSVLKIAASTYNPFIYFRF